MKLTYLFLYHLNGQLQELTVTTSDPYEGEELLYQLHPEEKDIISNIRAFQKIPVNLEPEVA